MALYRVEADLTDCGLSQLNGVNAVLVSAEDATEAKSVAAAATKPGVATAAWANATVTEITAPTTGLEGFRLRIWVLDPSDDSVVAYTESTGAAAADMDALGALAQTALNATASITGALYTAGTNTLVIAAGTGTDDLGDHKVLVKLLPPTSWALPDVELPGHIGTITDEGVSTADLSVVFNDIATPGLIASYNQLH